MKTYFLKALVYLILIIAIGCSPKTDGFIIQGEVTGFKDSTMLYLYDTDLQQNIDSTQIINGKFEFEGKLDEPKRLFLNTKYTDGVEYKYTSFFVENTVIKLEGSFENFRCCKITGSKSQDVEKKLIEKIKENEIQRDSLSEILVSNLNLTDSEHNEIWRKMNILDSLNDIQYINFINQNINSYAALEKLQWRMSEMPKDSLRKYFDQLTPEFKQSVNGKLIDAYLNARTVEIGEKYIDFEAEKINGEDFKLSDIKKNYILLDFWSVACAPCRKANKEWSDQFDFVEDRMELVSFSLDVKKKVIEKASKDDGIYWTNITDYKGNNSPIAMQYKIAGIPCSYLIDSNRIVIKRYIGYSPDFVDEIKEIVLPD